MLDKNTFNLVPAVAGLETESDENGRARHGVGHSSSTAAPLVALPARELPLGDELITTPASVDRTAGASVRLGAVTVVSDIEPETLSQQRRTVGFMSRMYAHIGQLSLKEAGLQARYWGRWLHRKLATSKSAWLRTLLFPLTRRGRGLARRCLAALCRRLYLLVEPHPVAIVRGVYELWRASNTPRPGDLQDQRAMSAHFRYRPTISILLPVFDPPLGFFEQALQSVLDQSYPCWELCIADDASTDPRVWELIEHYAARDGRIKAVRRQENGHISACTNSALALATGDYCAFLDHDDLLAPEALYRYVQALNQDRGLDVLYCDEDKIDAAGRHFEPHFKPAWCPDSLLARNYITHLLVARTSLVRRVGGTRRGFEGSQDYDLLLRLTEHTERIQHIPRVLYHWRTHAQSTAQHSEAKPYAVQAAVRALEEALQRRGEAGTVVPIAQLSGHYAIRYAIRQPGKVSIVIATRDQANVLDKCLTSLFRTTAYPDFEVILLDNDSAEPATAAVLQRFAAQYRERFRVLDMPMPFNYSLLMNHGVAAARGDYILLLNNDTELIHHDWLRAMVEQAQRPSVGCVGAKLLFPRGTIQHAGVALRRDVLAHHLFSDALPEDFGCYNWIQTINNFSAVTAACLMVRREVYDRVGGFDPALAVEYNDVDFCLRVREAGFNNLYLPHVCLYHHESLTRGDTGRTAAGHERRLREVAYFETRWQQYLDNDPCLSPHLSYQGTEPQIRFTVTQAPLERRDAVGRQVA